MRIQPPHSYDPTASTALKLGSHERWVAATLVTNRDDCGGYPSVWDSREWSGCIHTNSAGSHENSDSNCIVTGKDLFELSMVLMSSPIHSLLTTERRRYSIAKSSFWCLKWSPFCHVFFAQQFAILPHYRKMAASMRKTLLQQLLQRFICGGSHL